jgi:peptidoglycan biosynthesis protein MviN/MurJ (putative lipid II flippase)
VLSVVFIQSLGAVGAAVATVLAQAVYAALCLGVVNAEIGLRARYLLRQFVQVAGIAAVMGVVVLALRGHASGPLAIGAVVVTGTAVWGGLAVLSGFFSLDALYRVVPGRE